CLYCNYLFKKVNAFSVSSLTAYGDKYENSDNIGMTDIVAALEWIQENIDKFGGDPDNVTIFGQSGGGAKVLAMMTSPEAKGLFHKAIVQSGATENMGVSFLSKDISLELGALTLEKLGISEDNVDEIQTKSNVEIMDAAGEAQQELADKYQIPVSIGDGYSLEWEPVVDGNFLPTNPVTENGFADAGRDIPLLIGSNLNEWTTIMPTTAHNDMTDEQKELFSNAYPSKSVENASNVDTLIRLPMLKIMSHKADQKGAPVYAYVFTKQDAKMGSYHGLEIPYIFRSIDDNTLSNTISTAWVNFAKTGIPSAENLPEWEPYTREEGATMLLDDTSTLTHNHDKELIASLPLTININ
ncbi:MAG: carboxylesterase family protein, partial [Eubacteriales bacterium]|nr:carboxylesterase family protein [Eubacteriales bacterium]